MRLVIVPFAHPVCRVKILPVLPFWDSPTL